LLSRLTIVVPTYNRQKFIPRLIDFWSNTGVSLVILDGSEKSWSSDDVKFVGGDFYYYHSNSSIEERLGASVYYIHTDYVALSSDDEFFLPSACASCIRFLDQNLSFSSCKGQAVGFGWTGFHVFGVPVYPNLSGYEIDCDDSSQRMLEHMATYQMASLWAIQRRGVFEACMRAISSGVAFSSAAAGEIQVSLITAFMGKIKVVDELMWLRSFENRNIWWAYGDLSIADWWRDSSKSEEHERLLSSVVCFATDANGVPPTRDQVYAALEAYVAYAENRVNSRGFIRSLVKNSFIGPQFALIKRILSKIPIFWDLLIHYRKRVSLTKYVRQYYSAKLAEVNEISDRVSKFHSLK